MGIRSFNSLYEIPLMLEQTQAILKLALSILFMRFKAPYPPVITLTSRFPFNSLYEILQSTYDNIARYNTTFNSLYEIHHHNTHHLMFHILLSFNSLYEILEIEPPISTPSERAFNSLYEILTLFLAFLCL